MTASNENTKGRDEQASKTPSADQLAAAHAAGRMQGLEEAAAAVAQHDRAGREWIPGHLWRQLLSDAASRGRALLAASPAAPQPSAKALDVEAIMTKVQEFASTWAVAGGRFDDGTAMDRAEECRAELRALLAAEQPSEDERDAAARTLERLGYTYHGAELWEPPIGSAATELPRHALEAWRAVVRERRRQIAEEGWTPEHDDEHAEGQLAQAAATYAAAAALDGPDASVMQDLGARGTPHHILAMWPWDLEWWKPKDRRRNLERAGALILAELEHLIRAERKEGA